MKQTPDTHADAHRASRAVNLRQLLAGIAEAAVPDVTVTDLALDSRGVVPGGLFLAVPGVQGHGLAFLPRAVEAGAAVVLWEPATDLPAPSQPNALLIAVPGLKQMIGRIADRFFDHPSARVEVVGITGTNGKTTTAHLIAAAMMADGRPTAYAGTLGFGHVGKLEPSANTTPDCITVHRRLAELCASGDRHMSMEVSSHALDQGRVAGVRFHTAVFTNLTRDHLDYHKTFGAYAAAKSQLFHTPGLDHAVINVGDPFGDELVRQLAGSTTVTTYNICALGETAPAGHRLFARSIDRHESGLLVQFDGSWGAGTLRSPLIGDFNGENLLAALAVLLGWELPLDRALRALERSAAPPGRMEVVSTAPLAVIDYAHTPDALAKALRVVRQHAGGRVICVFGCGGERDRGKRPLMGAIADELADIVIVTDDNPRREDADRIIADIVAGMRRSRVRIERRREIAIAEALALATPEDVVLIAGKGHEEYQIVGTETLPFSDRECVRQALGLLSPGRPS